MCALGSEAGGHGLQARVGHGLRGELLLRDGILGRELLLLLLPLVDLWGESCLVLDDGKGGLRHCWASLEGIFGCFF